MIEEEANLPALYEELERIGADAAHWAEVEASDSTALVHVGSADPERIREQMIAVRREASERTKELSTAAEKVREEIRREVDRQRSEMEARMRAAMAALEPLQKQVKRMEEGIWTVNLYLGTREEIVTLRTGEPALIDTPITLRTEVLAMDEEVAAFPVEHGQTDWQGMDFRDVKMFDEWLTENPVHLAQVLPEPKGIVVFTPRRTDKVYADDPMVNAEMNKGNFESYWLIRNGDNLYRLRTDFKVGRNLMPVTSEFTALFRVRQRNWDTHEDEWVDIKPGTREWEKAEEAQDGKRRHYMRVALIVQGLIDRTEMFEPIHPAVDVMQQRTYDAGLVVVIDDTEKQITSSREPYYTWIKRLNRELRPGMRLMGNFHAEDFKDYAYDWRSDRPDSTRNKRLSPMGAEYPDSNVIHYIEGRKDGGFVIRYKRTEKVWTEKWVEAEDRPGYGNYGGMVLPKTRASAVIHPDDTFVIPYDLVTEEEMETYLGARTERHAYADSFPLLQAAIAAKREERESEAPFRDLLARVLADDNGQDVSEVEPHIDALVHRYKLGNKWHRPLVSMSQEDEAKALRLIRAEYGRIVRSGADGDVDAHAVAVLTKHDPEVMFVGRLSSGKYVAFAPMSRAYRPGAVHHDLWVREHTTTKTARTVKTREWVIPGVRGNKMTAVFEAERWTDWDRLSTAEHDLTDPEMRDLTEQARSKAAGYADETLLAIEHAREKRTWTVWSMNRAAQAVRRTARWSRDGGQAVLDEWSNRTEDFTMSYGGNRGLGSGVPASERAVYMPWHQGGRGTFGNEEGPQSPKPTAIYEADAEVLAEVVRKVRKAEDMANQAYDDRSTIHQTLRHIEGEQRRAKIEVIRQTFLADYPDESMWEEKRAGLTKNVRADVAVTSDHHFMRREPDGDITHLHDRKDKALRLDKALLRLIYKGHREWQGLTVGDAYALIDEPLPDVYEPLRHLSLVSTEDEEDDDDDE